MSVPSAGYPPHPNEAATCLDQWLRRTAQGTILRALAGRLPPPVLHEPGSAARSLDGFLRFYDHDRPHQGYRLRRHPPARSSGERFMRDFHPHSGPVTVSTPLRVWTH